MIRDRITRCLLAAALLLPPCAAGAVVPSGDAVTHSLLGNIIANLGTFQAKNAAQFADEMAKKLEEISQLVTMTQNTYNSVNQLLHSNNVLDAVYGGASLLGDGTFLATGSGASQAFIKMAQASRSLLSEYNTYLQACQFLSTMDRNFDFNSACSNVRYMSSIMQDSINGMNEFISIVSSGKTTPLETIEMAEEKAEEAKRKTEQLRAVSSEAIDRCFRIMNGEALAAALTVGAAASDFRTIGTDGGNDAASSRRSSSTALKSSKILGSSVSSGKSTTESSTISLSLYDKKDAKSELKSATPMVLDIASVITFVLGMLFTARNYARKHSGEHGSDNALLKTAVGTFVIVAIIQIVRALVTKM